jgi:hypothetical protein
MEDINKVGLLTLQHLVFQMTGGSAPFVWISSKMLLRLLAVITFFVRLVLKEHQLAHFAISESIHLMV